MLLKYWIKPLFDRCKKPHFGRTLRLNASSLPMRTFLHLHPTSRYFYYLKQRHNSKQSTQYHPHPDTRNLLPLRPRRRIRRFSSNRTRGTPCRNRHTRQHPIPRHTSQTRRRSIARGPLRRLSNSLRARRTGFDSLCSAGEDTHACWARVAGRGAVGASPCCVLAVTVNLRGTNSESFDYG
ncbi:hypothetical protein DL98DRAFT_20113 [Cadophora sp. DSE1049]|nr:hypothetical protein DL98DRAFT_20113 [Cadophora sp. DSE1049]